MALLRRCAACGAVVRKEDIRARRAIREGDRWYCSDCADLIRDPASPSEGFRPVPEPDADASPDDATVELSLPPVAGRLRRARRALERRAEPAGGAGGRSWTVLVTVLVLLVVLALVLVLFLRGG